MITLITGAPGAGKTAALVALLEEVGKDRAVYVHGIPELAFPHVDLADPTTWPDSVPDGSIIVIDEVQTVWRPSGPGQKIPEHIAKLETHRHRGLDFYIITQGPNLVHSNVRALVGRHVHLRDVGFLGRWWYEWPETADNCRTGWKTAPIKKRYKLPKHVFGTYKSASIHVKPVRSFPKVVLVLAAALVGAGVLAWNVYGTIAEKMKPGTLPISGPIASSTNPGQPSPTAQSAQSAQRPGFIDDRVDFMPRVSNVPESAPAYDHLRQIVNMPTIAGAMCKGGECTCYTAQGTRLTITSAECREWFNAPRFDHYRPQVTSVGGGSPSGGTPSAPAQTGPAPEPISASIPAPSSWQNPRADARPPALLPPGAAVQPTVPDGYSWPANPAMRQVSQAWSAS